MSELKQDSHRHTWELIPWLVNGSATALQSSQAQEHLRQCADCRAELAFQRRLRAALAYPQEDLGDAGSGWRVLSARIDSAAMDEPSRDPGHASPAGVRTGVPAHAGQGTAARWLMVAVIAEAVGLGAIGTAAWINRGVPAPVSAYRTLSLPERTNAAATIRVVLAPSMTLEQLRVLLNALQLEVVSGPGDAGIWSLAPTKSASSATTEAALRELRANVQVRLAEPIAMGGSAPPP